VASKHTYIPEVVSCDCLCFWAGNRSPFGRMLKTLQHSSSQVQACIVCEHIMPTMQAPQLGQAGRAALAQTRTSTTHACLYGVGGTEGASIALWVPPRHINNATSAAAEKGQGQPSATHLHHSPKHAAAIPCDPKQLEAVCRRSEGAYACKSCAS
jgi:hypothetical protein